MEDIANPDELLQRLVDLVRPFPDVEAIRLLCHEREPDSILSIVDLKSGALELAHAIDGFMFGTRPARVWRVPFGFRCPGRRDGNMITIFCAKCSVSTAKK